MWKCHFKQLSIFNGKITFTEADYNFGYFFLLKFKTKHIKMNKLAQLCEAKHIKIYTFILPNENNGLVFKTQQINSRFNLRDGNPKIVFYFWF